MNVASLSCLRFLAAIIVLLGHNSTGSKVLEAAPKILIAGPQI